MHFNQEKITMAAGVAQATDATSDCSDELEMVCDMFGKDFAELAALYRKDSPLRIALLHQAAAAHDYPRLAKLAHALSGSSASIGASGLSALCKELESCAKANTSDGFTNNVATIEAEYTRISRKLLAMTQPDSAA